MYYWKILRENRIRFFALLILGLVVGASVWPLVNAEVSLGRFEKILPAEVASRLWRRGMYLLQQSGGITLYFIGLMIGSGGLGEEMEHGSATFLFTRPRSRGYFVWSFWLACAMELLAFTLMAVLSGYATLFHLIQRPGSWSLLLLAPILLMITGLLGVGLANLLATASRSTKNALSGGLAFTVTYFALALVSDYYHDRHSIGFRLPTPMDLYSLNPGAPLVVAILGWLAVSVALVALSHWIVVRMEV